MVAMLAIEKVKDTKIAVVTRTMTEFTPLVARTHDHNAATYE
jgi:hypothetical protein